MNSYIFLLNLRMRSPLRKLLATVSDLSSTAPRLDPCLCLSPWWMDGVGIGHIWHRAGVGTPLWTTLTGQTPGRAAKNAACPPVHAVRGRCGALFSPRRSQPLHAVRSGSREPPPPLLSPPVRI